MKKSSKAIFLIILAIMIGIYINMVFFNKDKTINKAIKTPVVINEIKEYGYKLDDNETSVYKSLFKELQQILSKDNIDEEDYAKTISMLFVADFYNLNNKLIKNDIGGVEFIHPSAKDNFILKAKDTIYNYLESDIYGDRTQELPIVNNVEVTDIKQIEYKYLNNKKDTKAYQVNVEWTYKKDLGYETTTKITLVHDTNKLYITEMD
jgi:hypothetical protein